MANQEFTITFRTRAELEGAQAALTALEKQVGAAKAAGKPFEELAAKAAKARAAIQAHAEAQQQAGSSAASAAPQQVKLGEALETTGKASQKTAEQHVKLGELARGLGASFPKLAQALTMLINPYTAVVAAAAASAQAIRSWLDEVNEAAREQILTEMLDSQVASLGQLTSEFARSSTGFDKHLRSIGTGAKSAAKDLDAYNEKIEASIALQDRLQDAESALKKEQVRRKVATGAMTREAGLTAELEIDKESKQRKAAAEVEGARRELEMTSYAVGRAEDEKRAASMAQPAPKELAAAQRAVAVTSGKGAQKEQAAREKQEEALRNKLLNLQAARATALKGSAPLGIPIRPGDEFSYAQRWLTGSKTSADLDKQIAETERDLIAVQKQTEGAQQLAASATQNNQTLTTRQTEAKAQEEKAETELKGLRERLVKAKARYEEVAKLVPLITNLELTASQLAGQTQVEEAKAKTDKEIEDAVKNSVENGTPIPAETQQKIDARAQAQAPRPTPPSAPAATVVPRRPAPNPPTTGAEADAAQVRQDLVDTAAAQAAQWAAQSRTNAAGVDQRAHDRTIRAAMLRDGAFDPVRQTAQMETLGAEIVRELTQNTDVTTRNFRLFLGKIQDQNRQLAELGNKINTLESWWQNRR